MKALRCALLLAAVALFFTIGCENVLGVHDLTHVPDAASSDASIDTRISEDAASDTAANTSKDSADEGLDAGADVSVWANADADADANDATDAPVSDAPDAPDAPSETALADTVWWELASEAGGYQSLSTVIVPGELTPAYLALSFNFSFSFQPDVPPHPNLGSGWQAPYIALRWTASAPDASPAQPEKTAALLVPQALADAMELVDDADAGLTCSSSSPAVFPCVGAFDDPLFGSYRIAEVAFEWIPHRHYRYSVTRLEQSQPEQPPDASSSSWWVAAITDLATGTSVRIGRFRLKADSGGLQPISRTQVLGFPYCESPPPSVAAYAPRGERAGRARVALPLFQEASCVVDGGDAATR